ncbi:MAG: molybdopterin molybdotransferase MoeA [Chloroflexi bacterium]|nr:molybdopterin molybdotransferase MoeA [Chloroflexota bacterium]
MNLYPMIPFEQAHATILAYAWPLPPVPVSIYDALGLVLAEEVRADAPIPPFPASAMDGYAVRAADGDALRRVVAAQWAGPAIEVTVGPGQATTITTGAPLPAGADAVIKVEDTAERDGVMTPRKAPRPGNHVRPVGEDVAAGEVVLAAGAVLGPAEIGVLAAIGRDRVLAHPRPRVAVLSTGDELVDAGEPCIPGQIRDSNRPALMAAAQQAGAHVLSLGIAGDDDEALAACVARGLSQADVLITSGGVSMGERDLSRVVIEGHAQVHFGQVAQKPGRPFVFATVQRPDGRAQLVFGLPGFPAASLVTFENHVRPALRALAGHTRLFRPPGPRQAGPRAGLHRSARRVHARPH